MDSLRERVIQDNISIKVTAIEQPKKNSFPANWYSVTLRRGNQIITVPYGMDFGFDREPNVVDVLQPLLDEASSIQDVSFREWMRECCYDDINDASHDYRAIHGNTRKLRRFLGEDFRGYLNAERTP